MKKLLLAAALAAAFSASAAWREVGLVRIAGTSDLVGAIAKVGAFTGNPMIGAMAAGSIAKVPQVKFFGPMRPGAAVTLPIYLDDAVVPDAKNGYGVEYAVLYPVSRTKAQFVKAHPGCSETNGLVRVVCDDGDDDSDDLDVNYVGFSADGKWAAMSDKPEQVRLALSADSLKAAARPFKDGVLAFGVNARGMEAVRKGIDAGLGAAEAALAKEKDAEKAKKAKKTLDDLRTATAVVKMFEAFRFGLGVDGAGVILRGEAKPVAGTELAKVGLKSLPKDPLAFANPEAFSAAASAADCGAGSRTFAELWRRIDGAVRKAGFDLSPYLALSERKPGVATLTLDYPAFIGFVTNEENLAKIDFKTDVFLKEVEGLNAKDGFRAASPAEAVDFTVKGAKPAFSPSVRFAATMPALAGKPVFSASSCSLYAAFRALAPAIAKLLPSEQRNVLVPLLAALPPEGRTGIAAAGWREGESLKGEFRVSADEIKGCSALFNLAMALDAAKDGDGGDDDEDDGDDDDGE